MSIRVFLLTLVSAFILPKALEGIQLILVYVSLVSCWIHPLHRHSSRQSLVYVKNTLFLVDLDLYNFFIYGLKSELHICNNIQSEVLPSYLAPTIWFLLDGPLGE